MDAKLTTAAETKAKKGPAPVLDAAKRRLVLALITNGFSRRMAARYVRCAPSTITYTAERDPEFADELAAADNSLAVESLAAVRRAAKQDRHWRAAAWLLERQQPDDFTPPSRDLVSYRVMTEFFSRLLDKAFARVREDDRAQLEANLLELYHRMKHLGIASAKDYLEHLPTCEENELDDDELTEDLADEDFDDEDDDEEYRTP